MKNYRATEIVLQLYMNLSVLKYHLNLPKNWIVHVADMLHNTYAFLQSFYSDSEPKGLKKEEEGQTFAKNIQILVASGYASKTRFPIVQGHFQAAF